MSRRALVPLLLASAAWLVSADAAARAHSLTSEISGPDLPTPIALAWQDEVALLDPHPVDNDATLIVVPAGSIERLAQPPATFDPLYTVTSQLWPESGLKVGLIGIGRTGIYDPLLGIARVEGTDGVAWLRIGPARRAILDRYIVLGRKGVLDADPTVMEVLREARRNRMGGAIILDGHEIGPGRWDARLLWAEIEEAEARDVWPSDFAAHPSYPTGAGTAADGNPADPVVFGAIEAATADRTARPSRIDPLAAPAEGDAEFSFRLRDGQEIAFLYVAGTGLLVDVTALEREPSTEFATLPAFEMTSEFRTLVNRLIATGGVEIDMDGLRLGDVVDTTDGPWPPPGWQPPPRARGLVSPTPDPALWLNHRVAAGVRPVGGEALRFAAVTGVALATVAAIGLLRERR